MFSPRPLRYFLSFLLRFGYSVALRFFSAKMDYFSFERLSLFFVVPAVIVRLALIFFDFKPRPSCFICGPSTEFPSNTLIVLSNVIFDESSRLEIDRLDLAD